MRKIKIFGIILGAIITILVVLAIGTEIFYRHPAIIAPGFGKNWPTMMLKEGFVPGYSSYKAHWYSLDSPVFIFSYKCPGEETSTQIFDRFLKQISFYTNIYESSNELVLFKENFPEKYVRWHFVYDPASKIMTVMHSRVYSLDDSDWTKKCIQMLRKYHSKILSHFNEKEK